MESSFDFPDPSDWLGTPVSKLAPIETALRCQVCKDFFTTPVITSCSHTFCSLCIRRCLTNDGKCPTCRAVDQELRLRPNWVVQELVDAFQGARPEILQLGKDFAALRDTGRQENKKRKFEVADTDDEEAYLRSGGQMRKTRSQNTVERSFDNADENVPINDGLISCPICAKRMKEEDVFAHLDVHNEPGDGRGIELKDTATRDSRSLLETGTRSHTQPKAPMERLPQLNYSLLNDNALRKKLSGLGLPTNGLRGLLVRRHTEWVNLVNSNCDSRIPRSKRELLHELDVWERSQGRQILINGSSGYSIMDKDFDSAGWASRHDSEFQKLIFEAKSKAKSLKVAEDRAKRSGDELGEAKAKVDNMPVLEKQDSDQPNPNDLPPSVSNKGAFRDLDQSRTDGFMDFDAGA